MGLVTVLDPNDPRMYRNQRGRRGDHPLMIPEGPRVPITTGETRLPPPESHPFSARAALDPEGLGLALFVLVGLLFVIHARFAVKAQAAVGTR